MILKYDTTLEDVVAFNRYHSANSPYIRKIKLLSVILMAALLIFGSLLVPLPGEVSRSFVVVSAVVFSGLSAVAFNYFFVAALERQARRLYGEGMNRGTFGQHELEIDDDGIVERTKYNETRNSWRGVERIAETEKHAFIYVSSMAAHVIPKRSVSEGDPEAFIERAQQLCYEANSATGSSR